MKPFLISFSAAGLLAALLASGTFPAVAQAPAPSPLPTALPTPTPAPSATPTEIPGVDSLFGSPNGRGHMRYGAHASPAPPIPKRIGIEGVWELALQRGADTTYTHFQLVQQQNALTGYYIDSRNKRVPAVGVVDGNDVRIVVTMPDGTPVVFTGTLDGTTDMIGMMTTPTEQVPFSADYRPKEDFFNNLNEDPSGMMNPMPSPPPK